MRESKRQELVKMMYKKLTFLFRNVFSFVIGLFLTTSLLHHVLDLCKKKHKNEVSSGSCRNFIIPGMDKDTYTYIHDYMEIEFGSWAYLMFSSQVNKRHIENW